MKVHRLRLPGRSLCSIRSNRKWCKRRGSSLQCQNCFFVYPIIDCNLKNFRRCKIFRTQFVNGIFENANFRYAILREVNFRGTNLAGTDFSNSILDMVEFDEDNVGVITDASIQKSHIRVFVHFALFGGRKCVLERSLCGA